MAIQAVAQPRSERFIRLAEVCSLTGTQPSKTYQDVRSGVLPPPIKRGHMARWLYREIALAVNARAGGKTDADIRELVDLMVAARHHLAP